MRRIEFHALVALKVRGRRNQWWMRSDESNMQEEGCFVITMIEKFKGFGDTPSGFVIAFIVGPGS
jgi:hypothetical protein